MITIPTQHSLREGILRAFKALCGTVLPGAVYRSREAALARSEGTSIVVRPAEETPEFKADTFAMRDFIVEVEVIARGQIPDEVADPIVVAAHSAVMRDPTLGGLAARTIEDGTKWDFELADGNAVAVLVRYKVRYATPANTLAASF